MEASLVYVVRPCLRKQHKKAWTVLSDNKRLVDQRVKYHVNINFMYFSTMNVPYNLLEEGRQYHGAYTAF